MINHRLKTVFNDQAHLLLDRLDFAFDFLAEMLVDTFEA